MDRLGFLKRLGCLLVAPLLPTLPATSPPPCPRCGGSGEVVDGWLASDPGLATIPGPHPMRPCPQCKMTDKERTRYYMDRAIGHLNELKATGEWTA